MPRSHRRRKKKSGLRIGDRIICLILGTILGSITGAAAWGIIYLRVVARGGTMAIPFWTIFFGGLLLGVVGFAFGPERMMDIFENRRRGPRDNDF